MLSPDFIPHGYCYLWDSRIVWLHVISDGLITLSYYCIPIVLIYFIRKNHDLPFNRIFWMFGAFILACGTTHLMEIWNVWHGSYLLAGIVKAITAALSVVTAAMLIPLVPKAISLPTTSKAALEELADQKFALDQHAIVAVTDVQGTITYVNDKFCAISKYSKDELIGQNHRILKSGHHPKEFFQQMYHTIAHGQVWHGEIKNRAKDGSIYWVDTTIVPFMSADGKPRQYVAIRADITERKRAEERVLQRTAELETANQDLEAFTYSVSHDLRAPLRHMAGFSGLLWEEFGSKLDAQGQHYIHRIQEGTRKMGQLVDELLSLARVSRQSANLQVADLNAMVEEVVAMLKPEWDGRDVEWKIACLPSVACDSTLMKQVFQNLFSNALKYSRPRPRAVIEVGPAEANGQPVIFVRDNGVGFNMKYSDKLFGVFQRLHRSEDFEGTGVGLATVQRIIKKHGGRVWAEAELDKGATFYFTVDVAAAAEPNSRAATAAMGVSS
jgi:PAS domain S-box-containing protein